MLRHVTTSEIIDSALDTLVGSIYVSMPGSVISYDAPSQTATIQPLLNDVRYNVDTGQPYYEPWPTLQSVRVMWPTFGGAVLAGNLKNSDTVSLISWDYDPTSITGPTNSPSNPADVRKLSGNYWRAIPEGLVVPLPSAEASAAAAGILLGIIGDSAQIRYVPGTIMVGAAASDYVALANLVTTELGKIQAAIAGLQGVAPSGGGPVTITSTSPYTTVGNVSATVVKAQ